MTSVTTAGEGGRGTRGGLRSVSASADLGVGAGLTAGVCVTDAATAGRRAVGDDAGSLL